MEDKQNKTLKELFFRNVAGIIICIDENDRMNNYSLEISRKMRMTSSHTSTLITILEREGVIKKEKYDGRMFLIKLTKKGLEIKKNLINIHSLIDNDPKKVTI